MAFGKLGAMGARGGFGSLGGLGAALGPYIGFVATGGRNPTALNAGITAHMTRKRCISRVAIVDPSILIPNFYLLPNGGGEAGSGGVITATATFKNSGGTLLGTVTFTGSISGTTGLIVAQTPNTTGTAPDKSILIGTATGVSIAANTAFFVDIFVSCPSGGVYMAGTTIKDLDTANGEKFKYTGATDQTGAGGSFTTTDAVNAFGPCGIIASTMAPSIFIPGDSIGYGFKDGVTDSSSDFGTIARALGPFYGYSSLSIGGEKLSAIDATKAVLRIAMGNLYSSHVVMEPGTNDMYTDLQTLVQMQALANAFVARFPGKKILSSTLLPRATGTYPAGTGQAQLAPESVRVAYNDWLRSNPAGFTNCLEMADIYETNASSGTVTARNGGFWKLNSSFDGTHPNSTNTPGYQAASANNAAFPALIHRP